jgi:hypothetical protein
MQGHREDVNRFSDIIIGILSQCDKLFVPKMTSYSYYGQLYRQHLAALHLNENIKRQPRKSDNGNFKLRIEFLKYKTGDDYSV